MLAINNRFDFSFDHVAPTARLSWSAVRCGRALSNAATTSKSRSVIAARDVMSEMWNEISRASLSASCFALFTSARLRSEAVTWDYGERAELRKVGEQGEIYLADRPWKVSRALASETVQLHASSSASWSTSAPPWSAK